MTELELLVDCLRRLNRLGLTYYLTGSMASNYWGIPRTTHDLEAVQSSRPQADAVVAARGIRRTAYMKVIGRGLARTADRDQRT